MNCGFDSPVCLLWHSVALPALYPHTEKPNAINKLSLWRTPVIAYFISMVPPAWDQCSKLCFITRFIKIFSFSLPSMSFLSCIWCEMSENNPPAWYFLLGVLTNCVCTVIQFICHSIGLLAVLAFTPCLKSEYQLPWQHYSSVLSSLCGTRSTHPFLLFLWC